MGRVWLATDRRLGRSVALKEAVTSGAIAARLAREARITAGLEHPGIVAVHDAGLTAEGVPFYTMRVVQGRALDRVIAEASTLSERLMLMRSFLLACQAVGYAHSRGVLHRDLKPANVLLGAFGETQVADWGLATRLGDAEPSHPPHQPEPTSALALTHDGDVMGTPAYMSPEQARGEPASRQSDVWGLGAVLYELLAGRPPVVAANAQARLAAAREGKITPLREVAPDAPPELAAIVARALAVNPQDRYPDAGALAVDVAAWVDGRPVAAHTYTPRELLGRFVGAYRLPLAVASAALLLFAGAQAWNTWNLRAERDRAQQAELEARDALATSDQSLARALLEQAQTEGEHGALVNAQVLAASSLELRDQPRARGLLAGFAVASRPERLPALALPECDTLTLLGPERFLCASDSLVEFYDAGERRWTFPARSPVILVEQGRAFVGELPSGEARELDLSSGERLPAAWRFEAAAFSRGHRLWPRVDAEEIRQLAGACGSALASGLDATGLRDTYLLLCKDGRYGEARVGEPIRLRSSDVAFDFTATQEVYRSGGAMLLVSVRGDLARVDLASGASTTTAGRRANPLRGVRFSSDGARLVELPERGDVVVRSAVDLSEVARVPARRVRDAWLSEGGYLVVAEADRLTRWQLPAVGRGHVLGFNGGLSSIALSGDGRWLAAGGSQTRLSLRELPSGVERWSVDAGATTVKQVLPLANGAGFIWGGTGAPPQERAQVYGLSTLTGAVSRLVSPKALLTWAEWGFATIVPPTLTCRRLLQFPSEEILMAPYEAQLLLAGADGDAIAVSGCNLDRWGDLAPTQPPGGAWVLGESGALVRFSPAERRCIDTGAKGTGAVAALGLGFVTGGEGTLVAYDESGTKRWEAPHPGSAPTDLLTSPDGRYVVVAGRDRVARVYDAAGGRLVAVLEGHTERVASLAMAGDLLATGSWDGSVRFWDLSVLDTPAEQLVSEVSEAWGLTVEDVLGH